MCVWQVHVHVSVVTYCVCVCVWTVGDVCGGCIMCLMRVSASLQLVPTHLSPQLAQGLDRRP